MTDDVM